MFIRSQSITIFVVYILSRQLVSVICSSNDLQESSQEIEAQSENGYHVSSKNRRERQVGSLNNDLDDKNAQNDTKKEEPSDEIWSSISADPNEFKSKSSSNEEEDFEVSDSILNASHKSLVQKFSFGSRKSDSLTHSTGSFDQDIERRKEQLKQPKRSNKNNELGSSTSSASNNNNNKQISDKSRISPKLRFFKNYQPKKIYSLTDLLAGKPVKKDQEQHPSTSMKSNETSKSIDKSLTFSELNHMSQTDQLEQALALESYINSPGPPHSLSGHYPPANSPPSLLHHQRHQPFPYSSQSPLMNLNQPFMHPGLLHTSASIGQEASVNHHLHHNPALGLAYGSNIPQAPTHNMDQFHRGPKVGSDASMPMFFASGAPESPPSSLGHSVSFGKAGSINQVSGNKNSTAALSAAAAAVLLGERAKALLNQMSMSNAAAAAAAAAAVAAKNSNLLPENNSSGISNSNSNSTAPTHSPKLRPAASTVVAKEDQSANKTASLFENIESSHWPMSVHQHPSDVLAGAPTMVFEHTDETAPLDFETQLVGSGSVHTRNPADIALDNSGGDDDVSTTFYSEPAAHSAKMTRDLHRHISPPELHHPHPHPHPHPHRHPHSHPHYHRLVHNPMDFYDDTTGESPELYSNVGHQSSGGPPEETGSYGSSYIRPPSPVSHHDNTYPDSIDAIKEKSNAQQRSKGDSKFSKDNLMSLVRDRLSASPTGSTDQIKDLIRELQALTSKGESDTGSGSRKSSDKHGSSSIDFDDYEDLLGPSKDTDDVDRRRALRKKIIARIRAKYERQANKLAQEALSSSDGGSKTDDDSIRIPLHALLLAALDRRASSSEPSSSHIVLPDESDSVNLVQDEQSKYLINNAQRQFAEDTSGLAPLLNATAKMTEATMMSSLPQQQQQQSDQVVKTLLPLSESALAFSTGPLNQSVNVTQLMEDAASITGQPMQQVNVHGTTLGEHQVSNMDNKPQTQTVIMQPFPIQPNKSATKDDKVNGVSSIGGDFDVDEQVELYSRDDRRELEPSWMRRREDQDDYDLPKDSPRARKSRNRSSRRLKTSSSNIDNNATSLPVTNFEEDYEQMDRSARRKLRGKLWRRFKKRPPKRTRTPSEPPTESSYLADGEQFIENVSRDASDRKSSPTDGTDVVERNIASMDPEVSSGEDAEHQRSPERARQDDYDEADDDGDADTGQDNAPVAQRAKRRSRKRSKRRDRKSGPHQTGWRPGTIDDEVSKIEADAREKEGEKKENPTADEDQLEKDETGIVGLSREDDQSGANQPSSQQEDESGERSEVRPSESKGSRTTFKIRSRRRR